MVNSLSNYPVSDYFSTVDFFFFKILKDTELSRHRLCSEILTKITTNSRKCTLHLVLEGWGIVKNVHLKQQSPTHLELDGDIDGNGNLSNLVFNMENSKIRF